MTPPPTVPARPAVAEASARYAEFTVVDVRSPGEQAGGRLPGALDVPPDRLGEAASALAAAAARGPLLIVCASGNRSARGCEQLVTLGVETATPRGGTGGRTAAPAAGLPVDRPAGATVRRPMDRQVRLIAGALVLVGFLAGLVRPPAHRLSGLVGAGLFFSGATGTCGMAVPLAPLPYDRPPTDARPFEETPARPAPA